MSEQLIFPQKVKSTKDRILYVLLSVGPSTVPYLGVELEEMPENGIYPTLAEMLNNKQINIDFLDHSPEKEELECLLESINNSKEGYMNFFDSANAKELSIYYSVYLTDKGEEEITSKIKPESSFSRIKRVYEKIKG